MKQSFNDIEHLIVKNLFGTLSEEEQQQLDLWKEESPENVALYDKMIQERNLSVSYRQYREIRTQKAWNQFRKRVDSSYRMRRMLRYAASILLPLLLIGGMMLYFYIVPSNLQTAEVIYPGSSQATLVAGNGMTLVLEDDSLQQIPTGKGSVAMLKEGELSYLQEKEKVADKDTVLPDNTLQTHVGNEFRITLADGTRVHLNYNTTLKYPAVFGKRARVVYLKGEAFFEVAPDIDRPFYVITEGMKIKQYGTSFNVNAYSPQNTSVVLVKGSIGVVLEGEMQEEALLKPGQKAMLNSRGDGVRIDEVNVEKYTAWNEGYFYFEDESLENIMQTLSHWYNVKVEFKSPELKKLHFTGMLDRYSVINPTLRAISRTVDVKMKIERNTIIISN